VGIKESLFDYEHLAAYLLYRLNSIPSSPSIPPPYPPPLRKLTKARSPLELTESIEVFLDELAERMGYLQAGGVRDRQRAARWFIEWWRDAGGSNKIEVGEADMSSAGGVGIGGSQEWGWGLDCEWADRESDRSGETGTSPVDLDTNEPSRQLSLEARFDEVISRYMTSIRDVEGEVSETQQKKREKEEKKQRRVEKGDVAAKKREQAVKRQGKR